MMPLEFFSLGCEQLRDFSSASGQEDLPSIFPSSEDNELDEEYDSFKITGRRLMPVSSVA